MLPLPPPEPLALLQAAAEDSVTAGLASLPQDLRSNSTRHVVTVSYTHLTLPTILLV